MGPWWGVQAAAGVVLLLATEKYNCQSGQTSLCRVVVMVADSTILIRTIGVKPGVCQTAAARLGNA
jgi:hypothetical protein